MNAEQFRLIAAARKEQYWRRWGPYLAERAWGTVREDYSPGGNAWEYFPFEHAHLRAYRWGEDGIAGISDNHQRLCFAIALWNERDPILKERLFGLSGEQGNHGEDVKECYYYLDSTPTHTYMKCLYKYPQAEFPYTRLIEENRRRTRDDPEFERALDLARQAEHRVPADRRRALGLLARLLGEERVGVEARELAWSKPEPSPAALSEVVDEIEQGARRQ